MTKEQEEAISRLRKITNRQILYGNKFGITIEGFKELQEDLETVLNMLEEKGTEIDKYKRKNKELSNQLLKIYKEQDNYNARIEKKDKMIELMTLFMSNLDIDEEICKHQVRAFCDNKPEGVTLDVCAKCIKQYFERKVENGG